ncbi:MAG: hypothetical protein QNJ98_08400 [Planctomycetota bacterium]|nr:hypothetical protein [Planctomycetota bacterium]
MTPRLALSLLFVLVTTAACGGGGGGGDAPAVAIPRDFVHTVTNANAVANATMLENPLTFGRPDLVILVTQNRSPEGLSGQHNHSFVGVLYDAGAGDALPLGRWFIQNMDITAEPTMRPGMAFNVSLFEPTQNMFVHEVTRNGQPITHMPRTAGPLHGARDTRVFVTQRLSLRDGSFGAANRDSVRTHWTGGQWSIMNQNGRDLPRRAAFNVVMVAPSAVVDAFNATTARSTLWYDGSGLTENAILHITQGPGDTRGVNHREVALRYSSSRGQWGVANVDGSSVRQFATMKILIRRP